MQTTEQELWARYWAHRTDANRNQIVEQYLWLAKAIAKEVWQEMKADQSARVTEYGDLLSYAHFGLLRAVRKYDASTTFKYYAGLCIRGAIAEWLRRTNPFTRARAAERTAMAKARSQLMQQLDHPPTNEEVADAAGLDLMRQRVTDLTQIESLTPDQAPHSDAIGVELDPSARIEQMDSFGLMVQPLRPRDRRLMELIYVEGLTQREAAKRMGVSLSWARTHVAIARGVIAAHLIRAKESEVAIAA